MSEIVLGDVHVRKDGDVLTISSRQNPDFVVSLDTQAVDALSNFVAQVNEDSDNRRTTYRVPLHGMSAELKTRIRKGGKQFAVTPTNISITGIFVIPKPGERRFTVEQREQVQVVLELDGHEHCIDAVVVRQQGNGIGFFFPEAMQGEQIQPPRELVELVMELQRRMIAKQAESSFGVE